MVYRGWLLWRAGQRLQAQEQFSLALDQCLDNGQNLILQWIGVVIVTLAKKLGLDTPTHIINDDMIMRLKQKLPQAPYAELEYWQKSEDNTEHSFLITQLRQCLPFNFH
jgi:hypothetical protein